jgi:hypothetical protein
MATRNTNITVPKLEKGVIGGDIDRWGYKWNENIDKLSEFHTKVIADSEMQNQELARLENEKLNIEDIPSKVEPVVQEFLETTIKPEIDDYVNTVSKPDITKHVETKKQEINTYVNTTSKPALDSYEKEKEKELNTYTTTKKGELDSHTIAKKGELDAYEKTKETQLNNYTGTKQTQLDSYTNTKKGELDTHTTAKEGQLDTYTTGKEGELDTHTGKKKSELDAYEKTKEEELNTFTSTKKTEITNHTNTKKGELDTYTTQKKGEITTHTDSEIERINADSELANKVDKTIQVIAGNGLVDGGDLSTNITLNIASADDGITVNADNIKLNIVDNATTDSATRAGSARQIKLLNENKQKKFYTSITELGFVDNKSTTLKQVIAKMELNTVAIINIYSIDLFPDLPSDFTIGSCMIFRMNNSDRNVIYLNDNNGQSPNYIGTYKQQTSSQIVWSKIITDRDKLFLGTSGISSVTYIQDSGTKTQGQGYIDKSTGQVYLCLKTNTDTTITDKFMSITNVELGKKVDSGFWKLNPKQIGNNSTVTDLNTIYERGFYTSTSNANKFINVPESNMGAFELTVSSITDSISYTTQLIKSIINNNYYVRTQTSGIGNPVSWTKWTKLLLDTDIVDNLTTADKSKVLSANMGVKLNTSGYDGQGRGSLRNNSLNIDQIKKSGAWYIYDKNLKPFIGIDYAYLQHIQYNDNDVGAWQLMCPDNKLELYTRVCAGITGKYTDWEQILTSNNKLFLGNAGISKVIYIQDAGEKTAGNGYVDKTTGQLYLCKTTTTDTSVTDKFLLATNIENRDRISVIEEKLGIYHPVGKISTISVSRDENSSSPNLGFSSL